MLSGRGLCDGLITRTEESYRVWCVCVTECDQVPLPTVTGEKEVRERNGNTMTKRYAEHTASFLIEL